MKASGLTFSHCEGVLPIRIFADSDRESDALFVAPGSNWK